MSEALTHDVADVMALGASMAFEVGMTQADADRTTREATLSALVYNLARYPEPVFHQVCLEARKAGRLPEVLRA